MSFWKNPEYKALRMVIVLVVLVAIAYFAVSAKKSNSLDQSGKVIETSNDAVDGGKEGLGGCNVGVAYAGDSCTVTTVGLFGICRHKNGNTSEQLDMASGSVVPCCDISNGGNSNCVSFVENEGGVSFDGPDAQKGESNTTSNVNIQETSIKK